MEQFLLSEEHGGLSRSLFHLRPLLFDHHFPLLLALVTQAEGLHDSFEFLVFVLQFGEFLVVALFVAQKEIFQALDSGVERVHVLVHREDLLLIVLEEVLFEPLRQLRVLLSYSLLRLPQLFVFSFDLTGL